MPRKDNRTKLQRQQEYQKYKEKIKIHSKNYYQANKEKICQREKQYRLANKESTKSRNHKWYQNNKEKTKAKQRDYNFNNKEAISIKNKERYQKHKQERYEYGKKYRALHKEELAKKKKAYAQKNKTKVLAYHKKYYEKKSWRIYAEREHLIKIKAYEILGNKCVICGCDDTRVLQIDHINGGGCKESRKIGTRGIRLKIINGQTEEYQLLCPTCNILKRLKNGEVGNKKERQSYLIANLGEPNAKIPLQHPE